MRIIAGEFKGQRLTVPRDKVRPTSERLRGSLFNALGGEFLMDSLWLDAFAGSGAVGIEALSRGAQHVIFNDRDRLAHKVIRSNLERCGISTGFTVLQKDVFVLLRDPPASLSGRPLSVLFLDPPYDFGRYRKLLLKAIASCLVDENTLVVLEVFKKTKLEFIPKELCVLRTLKSGDSHLLLLSRE
jgi:16S rRNA (guanine966-N2)-methyltransferase